MWPGDSDIVVSFLSGLEWPFHGVSRLSPDAAAAVPVAADDVASFWIRDRDQVVGLIRLFDLDDVDNGSALFDLRIATEHRNGASRPGHWPFRRGLADRPSLSDLSRPSSNRGDDTVRQCRDASGVRPMQLPTGGEDG
jgi:hypothetical protein